MLFEQECLIRGVIGESKTERRASIKLWEKRKVDIILPLLEWELIHYIYMRSVNNQTFFKPPILIWNSFNKKKNLPYSAPLPTLKYTTTFTRILWVGLSKTRAKSRVWGCFLKLLLLVLVLVNDGGGGGGDSDGIDDLCGCTLCERGVYMFLIYSVKW